MSVIPAKYDFKDHYRGSTFAALPIKFNFDITGATVLCQIRKQAHGDIIHEWKTGVNITNNNLLTGDIVLQKIVDFAPEPLNYEYDVRIYFANDDVETYMKGFVKVIQNISEE